jgi:Domain of unknown function (DUF6249)
MDSATIIGLIIAFVAVFGLIGIATWFIVTRQLMGKDERLARIEARNKERLALIEKGMDPNLADQVPHKSFSHFPFLIGLVLVFAVLGRIIAFSSAFNSSQDKGIFIFALPAFFAGLGFLFYHFYQKRVFRGKNK